MKANVPYEANLGYFERFMRAWGKADQPTRDEVNATTVRYRLGLIDGWTEDAQVSTLLNIAPPLKV